MKDVSNDNLMLRVFGFVAEQGQVVQEYRLPILGTNEHITLK